MVKNLPTGTGDAGSVPGSGRSPGEGNGNHFSILPGEFHGPRSLVDYHSGGHKESDMTERLFVSLLSAGKRAGQDSELPGYAPGCIHFRVNGVILEEHQFLQVQLCSCHAGGGGSYSASPWCLSLVNRGSPISRI